MIPVSYTHLDVYKRQVYRIHERRGFHGAEAAEYFKKDSKDLLFDVSQPASVGVTSIIQTLTRITLGAERGVRKPRK